MTTVQVVLRMNRGNVPQEAAAAARSIERIGQAAQTSSRQTVAAMRQLPAQFTDIVTSLQGGQNPFTVLLQQGGQIKDSFGGIGAALRGVAQAIGPVGAVVGSGVAAALAFAAASERAAREANTFTTTLAQLGGTAGVTASQLAMMASAIGESGKATTGDAAAALARVVGTGQVATDQLQYVTERVLELNKATGKSVEDLVAEFASLGQDPVRAVLELDGKYKFLTLSVYEQIKALDEQGDKQGAAQLATEKFGEATAQMAAKVQGDLRGLAKFWADIEGAAKRAMDAMAEPFRAESTQDRIASLERAARAQRDIARQARENSAGAGMFSLDYEGKARAAEQAALRYIAQADALRKKEAQTVAQSKADRDGRKITETGLAAEAEITRITQSLRSNNEQLEAELQRYAQSLEKVRAANPNSKLLDPETVKKNQDRIRAKYAQRTPKQQGPKGKSVPEISAENEARIEREWMAQREAAYRRLESQMEQEIAQAQRSAQSIVERVQSLKDEAEAMRLVEQQNISLGEAVEMVQVKRLEELRARRLADGADQAEIDAINAEIEARKELGSIMASKAVDEASREAAEKARDYWLSTAKSIEDALTDAIIEGGSTGAEAIRRMFKGMVLRPIISAAVQPMAQSITSTLLGPLAGAGLSGGGFNLGSLGGLMDVQGMLAGSWSAVLSSSIAGAGSLFGIEALSSFAAGMKGASLAAGLAGPTTAGAGGAMGLGQMFSGAMSWAGPIGIGLAVLDGLGAFEGPTYHTGSAIGISATGASTGRLGVKQRYMDQTVWGGYTEVDKRGGAAFESPLTQVGQAIVGSVNAALKTFGSTNQVSAYLAYGADGNDDSEGQLRLYNADGSLLTAGGRTRFNSDPSAGFQEYVAEAGKVARAALLAADIPGWAQDVLNSLGASPSIDAVTEAIAKINGGALAIKSLGNVIANFAGLTDSTTSAVIKALGGLDSAATGLDAYYQTYYSQSERAANSLQQLTAAAAAAGITLPKTKDGFRELMESYDLSTEAGRSAYATLLGLSAQFAQTADAAQQLTEQVKSMGSGLMAEIERVRAELDMGPAQRATLMTRFATTTAQARAGDEDALRELPNLSRALLEATKAASTSALDYAAARASTLSSLEQTLAEVMERGKVPGFASGGYHAGGLRLVGETGMEAELTGASRIFNAGQTANLLANAMGSDRIVEELAALRGSIEGARVNQQAEAYAMARHLSKISNILERVTPDGNSLAITNVGAP